MTELWGNLCLNLRQAVLALTVTGRNSLVKAVFQTGILFYDLPSSIGMDTRSGNHSRDLQKITVLVHATAAGKANLQSGLITLGRLSNHTASVLVIHDVDAQDIVIQRITAVIGIEILLPQICRRIKAVVFSNHMVLEIKINFTGSTVTDIDVAVLDIGIGRGITILVTDRHLNLVLIRHTFDVQLVVVGFHLLDVKVDDVQRTVIRQGDPIVIHDRLFLVGTVAVVHLAIAQGKER